jgi:hypothetical protein
MPGSIPGANAHNILLHIDHGPRDETDRVLQIAREGLAAARYARRELLSLRGAIPDDARLLADHVCDLIASRNAFGTVFREAAERLYEDSHGWGLSEEEHTRLLHLLETALEASETVSDMSAAVLAMRKRMVASIPT